MVYEEPQKEMEWPKILSGGGVNEMALESIEKCVGQAIAAYAATNPPKIK